MECTDRGLWDSPMRIALAQSNLDKADEYLMDVSHPESPNFGKHWTAKQVAEMFAPSQESYDAVTFWLRSSGTCDLGFLAPLYFPTHYLIIKFGEGISNPFCLQRSFVIETWCVEQGS